MHAGRFICETGNNTSCSMMRSVMLRNLTRHDVGGHHRQEQVLYMSPISRDQPAEDADCRCSSQGRPAASGFQSLVIMLPIGQIFFKKQSWYISLNMWIAGVHAKGDQQHQALKRFEKQILEKVKKAALEPAELPSVFCLPGTALLADHSDHQEQTNLCIHF